MIKQLDIKLFKSKFSLRILLLFILSTIIPIVVIAFFAFTHISSQLTEHSYELSRQTSKTIGMDLLRRLSIINSELADIAKLTEINQLNSNKPNNSSTPAWTPREKDFDNLQAMAYVTNTGEVKSYRGNLISAPELTATEYQILRAGKAVIQMEINSSDMVDINMIRLLNPEDVTRGLIIGQISPDFLWSLERLLSDSSEIFVLDSKNNILFGKPSAKKLITDTLTPLLNNSITGFFTWKHNHDNYIASYWSLFTQTDFSIPYLVIVVSNAESDVLEPIVQFKNIYFPVLLLTILLISFFVVNRIRKKIDPLITLTDATRKIASGDFSNKIEINSNDEFSQLGQSFNFMSDKLNEQFSSISTMAEIDRLILSSFDARYIIDVVLDRAEELTPCKIAAIITIDNENSCSGILFSQTKQGTDKIKDIQVHLGEEDLIRLTKHSDYLHIHCDNDCPDYLKPLAQQSGISNFLIFPALIKQRLFSISIFGYQSGLQTDESKADKLRKFSDHVAIALSNASWEGRLYHQAHYDTLTNLPNRALLKDRLEQAVTRANRNNTAVGIFFIDLDRFKLVNDTLGHAAGDLLLQNTAHLLKSNVRSVDTVVRFGGDEFVIIIPDLNNFNHLVFELGTIAEKILRASQVEMNLGQYKLYSDMSIGISVYPKDGSTSEELIKHADTAMYHAKENGRARYQFFANELNASSERRMEIEQDIRHALERNEFSLHYQPKIDSHSGRIAGAEALIRWQHPIKGNISPLEFISIAEDVGLIHDIGYWVLRTACHQLQQWNDDGLPEISIAVNLSPKQFRDNNLLTKVDEIIKTNDINPATLEIEVTEGAVMEDPNKAIEILHTFRNMGLTISIDDFGTGYSSLSYLRKLPINSLKIDRSFITDIIKYENDQAIVSSTIILAHKLGLTVIAEGVETEEQKSLLAALDCDTFQGYLFSKPVPANEFANLISKNINYQNSSILKPIRMG